MIIFKVTKDLFFQINAVLLNCSLKKAVAQLLSTLKIIVNVYTLRDSTRGSSL